LWLDVKTIVKKPEPYYHKTRSNDGLRDSHDYRDSKQRSASCPVANRFRARDKCGDRIVEAEHTDLADDVSGRPGNRVYAERHWSEQPRNEECEYPAEIRRQHGNGVQKGAAFQLDSSLINTRRRVYHGRRDVERDFSRVYWLFTKQMTGPGQFQGYVP